MTFGRFLFVAAAFCFLIALALAAGSISGGNEQAWVDGGLLAVALGLAFPTLPR